MKKCKPHELVPASASAKPWVKLEPLFDDPNWYAESKLDGWRFLMHFGGNLDRVYLTGRNRTKAGTLSERGLHAPQFDLRNHLVFGYTVLDGEIMPPQGAGFNSISGIMGNTSVEKALARIKTIGHPEYHVFDCLYYNGQDIRNLPQHQRKMRADRVINYVWKSTTAPVWSGSRRSLITSIQATEDNKRAFYDAEIAAGREGIMLKDRNAVYGEGWVKVKRMHTLDVIITGFTEAKEGKTGKFKGLIGAVIVSVHRGKRLVEVGQVSGMNDELRVNISKHPRRYLNKPLEIKAQEFAKDRLRHPRWSRMRRDLSTTVCTWEKMQRDLCANKNK